MSQTQMSWLLAQGEGALMHLHRREVRMQTGERTTTPSGVVPHSAGFVPAQAPSLSCLLSTPGPLLTFIALATFALWAPSSLKRLNREHILYPGQVSSVGESIKPICQGCRWVLSLVRGHTSINQ